MSPDARDSLADLCQAALERGLAGFAVTDHFDTEPGDPGYGHYDGNRLLQEVEAARRAHGARLAIMAGAEVCFQPVFLPCVRALLDACPLDYVVGSVHWVAREYVDGAYFSRQPAAKAYEAYFAALGEAVSSGLFDAIAHFDLPKRYTTALLGPFDPAPHWPAIERVLRSMVARGTALEINTSGWRQALGEPLPGEAILRRYRELGGTRITIGSDAHSAAELGGDVARAQELARRIGFTHLTRFSGRRPQLIPL